VGRRAGPGTSTGRGIETKIVVGDVRLHDLCDCVTIRLQNLDEVIATALVAAAIRLTTELVVGRAKGRPVRVNEGGIASEVASVEDTEIIGRLDLSRRCGQESG